MGNVDGSDTGASAASGHARLMAAELTVERLATAIAWQQQAKVHDSLSLTLALWPLIAADRARVEAERDEWRESALRVERTLSSVQAHLNLAEATLATIERAGGLLRSMLRPIHDYREMGDETRKQIAHAMNEWDAIGVPDQVGAWRRTIERETLERVLATFKDAQCISGGCRHGLVEDGPSVRTTFIHCDVCPHHYVAKIRALLPAEPARSDGQGGKGGER